MSRLFGLEFSYLPLILFLTSAILAAVSLQQMPDKGFSAQRATQCFCIENSKSGAPHKALVCPEKKKMLSHVTRDLYVHETTCLRFKAHPPLTKTSSLAHIPLNSLAFQYRQNITAILQHLKHKVVKSSTQLYRKHYCSHTALAKHTRKYHTSALLLVHTSAHNTTQKCLTKQTPQIW